MANRVFHFPIGNAHGPSYPINRVARTKQSSHLEPTPCLGSHGPRYPLSPCPAVYPAWYASCWILWIWSVVTPPLREITRSPASLGEV